MGAQLAARDVYIRLYIQGEAHALSILKAHGVSFALNGLYAAN